MSGPSVFEQELLERTNHLRTDPGGELERLLPDGSAATPEIASAIRYFGVDTAALASQLAALTPVAPLAWNADLARAADAHSALMAKHDEQSHNLPGEAGLYDRIAAAGYDGARRVGENLFAFTEDPLQGHAGFVIDWGYDDTDYISDGNLRSGWDRNGDGIQDPAGHRITLMNAAYSEVGIEALREAVSSTSVGPWIVTQNFGTRQASEPQLVGVVIDDADGDGVYDAGEGLSGVRVTAIAADGGNVTTTSWNAGGYQMALSAGEWQVTFSGGALNGEVTRTVRIAGENVKLDAFADDAEPAISIGLKELIGAGGSDWLTVGRGTERVDGGAGFDMVSFVDLAQRVVVRLSEGSAKSGGATVDLSGIERVTGSVHGDLIEGDAGANTLRGLGGYDWFNASDGGDAYEGGTGRDMVSYVKATSGVKVDLGAGKGLSGMAQGDTYTSIERFTGSVHSDMAYGSSGEDDFRGLGGYDWFVGSDGGKDRYDGGAGQDTVAYTQSKDGITASLALGRGSKGDAARDLYTSIENLTGTNSADQLTGDHGRNMLRGMYGEDHLKGLGGVDRLWGGGSDDVLDGGDGWDLALYDHGRDDYQIIVGNGIATVTYLPGGGEGRDLLINIEAISFADEMVYL
jgi:hypothetical protein